MFPDDAVANDTDTRQTQPNHLWQYLIDSNRLAYAPKNEMMSEDEDEVRLFVLSVWSCPCHLAPPLAHCVQLLQSPCVRAQGQDDERR